MVATQEQTHKMLYGAGGGRPGKRHCTLVYIPVHMNRVLPKWYNEVAFLSLLQTFMNWTLAIAIRAVFAIGVNLTAHIYEAPQSKKLWG